jgi:hypothetical protein
VTQSFLHLGVVVERIDGGSGAQRVGADLKAER